MILKLQPRIVKIVIESFLQYWIKMIILLKFTFCRLAIFFLFIDLFISAGTKKYLFSTKKIMLYVCHMVLIWQIAKCSSPLIFYIISYICRSNSCDCVWYSPPCHLQAPADLCISGHQLVFSCNSMRVYCATLVVLHMILEHLYIFIHNFIKLVWSQKAVRLICSMC